MDVHSNFKYLLSTTVLGSKHVTTTMCAYFAQRKIGDIKTSTKKRLMLNSSKSSMYL